MQGFTINYQGYAVGLVWDMLSGEKVSAEVAMISDNTEMNIGIIRKSVHGEHTTHQLALSSDEDDKGLISAAGVFATLEENALIVESLGDDLYWICGSSGYAVIPGSDVVVSESDISAQISDIYGVIQENIELFKIYVSSDVSLATGIDGTHSYTFEQVLEAHEGELDKKILNSLKIKQIRTKVSPAVLLCAFLMVVAGGGYVAIGGGESYYENESPDNTFEIIRKGPTQQELLAKAYDEEVQWLLEDMGDHNPNEIIRLTAEFVSVTPMNVMGWDAMRVFYNASNPGYIQISWERGELGTPLDLKRFWGDRAGFSVNETGSSVTTSHKIEDVNKRTAHEDIVGAIALAKYKREDLVNDLINENFEWQISTPEKELRRESIKDINDPVLASTPTLNINKKDFNVSDNGIERAVRVSNVVGSLEFVSIKSVDFELSNDYKFTISGVIYEK